MIGQLFEGFSKELEALFMATGATVLRDTQFKEEQMPAYTMPLIILGINDSPENTQLPGGTTQEEWDWSIKVYFYDSNSDMSPDFGLSTDAWNIVDQITKHINLQTWLSTDFANTSSQYSFKLTFNGIIKAQELKAGHGMIPGLQINYSSIGLNTDTSFSTYSESTLQTVEQLPIDKNSWALDVSTNAVSIAKTAGAQGTFDIITNLPWIASSDQTWSTLSEIKGFGDTTMTLTALVNIGAARTANVTIKAPGSGLSDKVIVVTQASGL